MQGKVTTFLFLLLIPVWLFAQAKVQKASRPAIDREGGKAASEIVQRSVAKGAAAPVKIGNTWNSFTGQSPYTNLISYDPFSKVVAVVKRTDRTGAGSGRIVYQTSQNDGATWSAQVGPVNATGFNLGRHPNCVVSNPTKSTDPANAIVISAYNDLTAGGGAAFGDVQYVSDFRSTTRVPDTTAGHDGTDAFSYAGAVDLNNGNVYFATVGASGNYAAVTKLTNSGRTLSPRVTVTPAAEVLNGSAGVVDVGNDGTVHYVTNAQFTAASGAPTSAIFLWRYQRSTDGGATWSAPEYVNPNLAAGRHDSNYEFDFIVDGNNQPHIAALLVDTTATDPTKSTALYDLARSSTGTWSATKVADIRTFVFNAIPPAPGATPLQQLNEPEFAKTQNGSTLAIKWIDTQVEDTQPDIWISSKPASGGSWSTPVNVSNTFGLPEVFTNLATYMNDNGQLYVFYTVGGEIDIDEAEFYFLPDAKIHITAVNEKPQQVPADFVLQQNYPNPFNPSTNINFSLPKSAFVKLQVLDVLGNEVATLINGRLEAGPHQVSFAPQKLSSGVYFYRLQAGDFSTMKKMVLMQ